MALSHILFVARLSLMLKQEEQIKGLLADLLTTLGDAEYTAALMAINDVSEGSNKVTLMSNVVSHLQSAYTTFLNVQPVKRRFMFLFQYEDYTPVKRANENATQCVGMIAFAYSCMKEPALCTKYARIFGSRLGFETILPETTINYLKPEELFFEDKATHSLLLEYGVTDMGKRRPVYSDEDDFHDDGAIPYNRGIPDGW